MYQDNQDEDDKLKNDIEKFRNILDEEVEGNHRSEYLIKCKQMSENIKKEIQKRIKKGDENQIMKLMKYYSQQNKRLQEMEYNNVDEDTSLLHDNHQVEVQLFEDNVTQRKQRLQNVHKSMETVKSIYEKIHEVATQQVDQMFTIEDNYTYAENKTQKASQELVKAQQSLKTKIGYRIVIICILILIVGLMFVK
ncbi:unnamed protein product [Paramecium primaurelia]|uniref:t-SNARE coiled-coil homology domain-containing protein n=2 Tax=Paramecium TaxID=5884 RepID=A0A8S1WEY0_9CILI|nr:unnamed protein product [Paramecium primaurelia]CAD8186729.1 unnamed protein product [Paramecium pentaurelia]